VSNKIGERSGSDPNRFALLQHKPEADMTILISGRDEAFDYSHWNGLWLSGLHQETLNSQGAINAPPTISSSV
jgi:hypothetical protein